MNISPGKADPNWKDHITIFGITIVTIMTIEIIMIVGPGDADQIIMMIEVGIETEIIMMTAARRQARARAAHRAAQWPVFCFEL